MSKSLLNEYISSLLMEINFPGVRTSMMGLDPKIQTAGIMTAENPEAEKLSKSKNKLLNKSLINDIRKMGYGAIKIQGSFGIKEKSFLIQNISKEEIISLGRKYNQESVIFGERMEDKDGKPFMRWHYIETKAGSAYSPDDESIDVKSAGGRLRDDSFSNTLKSGEKVQDREDFYSAYKGKKFLIPFFDDDYQELKK